MSHFYYPGAHPGSGMSVKGHNNMGTGSGHHHHNTHRSRKNGRFASAQNSTASKGFKDHSRGQSQKEAAEAAHFAALRREFEAARSFDLEDDEIFCPWHLLTEDDLQTISTSGSDRSSSSGSDSPDHSPLQHQLQPTSNFASTTQFMNVPGASFQPSPQYKLHQPQAQRTKNPIPIVDPNARLATPPDSRQGQKNWYTARRW